MFEEITIRYFHPVLKIGMHDIRNLWLLEPFPVKLINSLHQGNLVYRIPRSGKRISYKTLKKGLIKKTMILRLPVYLLPF